MRTIEELLNDSPFYHGLPTEVLAHVAGCAQTARFEPGEVMFRAGQPANTFFLVRHGRVSIELFLIGNCRNGGIAQTLTGQT